MPVPVKLMGAAPVEEMSTFEANITPLLVPTVAVPVILIAPVLVLRRT